MNNQQYDKLGPSQYFATLQGKKLTSALNKKVDEYYTYLDQTGLWYLWMRTYQAYYGASLIGDTTEGLKFDSARLSAIGKSGERINAKINHLGNDGKHILNLVTAQRPAMSAKSTNTDYKSQTQTILATGILEYYFREKKAGDFTQRATETSLQFGEGFIHSPWNPNLGEKIMPNPQLQGGVQYEGDIQLELYDPTQIPRNVSLTDSDEHDWYFVCTRQNRWNLMARYPELAKKIRACGRDKNYDRISSFSFGKKHSHVDEDEVIVWTFYHNKTEAIPEGRLVQFIGEVTLIDIPLPYEKIPLHRVAPSNLKKTIFGWSPLFDILAPQQMLDILNSTIMTNQAAFGVQSIQTKPGAELTISTLESGMKLIETEEPVVPLQLTSTAAEIFQYRNEVKDELNITAGLNNTVKGQPEASLESGAALALMVAQAVQFANMLEASYISLIESLGTSIIQSLQSFANTKRIANIVGEDLRGYQQEFTKDDISAISRVQVEQVNPMSKTIAGRLQMAENYANRGYITDVKDYNQVVETGQTRSLTMRTLPESLNIKSENERLRKGIPVIALITDHHPCHIDEHVAMLSDPEARENPQLTQQILMHIQEHEQLWVQATMTRPALLQAKKIPPAPVPAQPALPPPPGAEVGGGMSQTLDPGSSQLPSPKLPNQPNLPQNAPEESQQAYADFQSQTGPIGNY